jgi:hypothetical protein
MEGLQITLDVKDGDKGDERERRGLEGMNFNSAFKIKILTHSNANTHALRRNSSSAPPLGDLPQYSRNHRRREISSNVETRLNGYILQDVEGDSSLVDGCCRGPALEYRNYLFLV